MPKVPVIIVLVLLVATGLPAAGARAGESDDLIAEGVKLRKEHRDREALAIFRRAYDQQASPRAAAQMGLCEHALGLWLEAETHLEQALAATQDPWVAKNQATVRADLTRVRTKLGSIEVWGTPAGAIVSIDNRQAGTLPLPIPLRAIQGRRVITVTADGYLPESRTVEVQAEATVREHVALATATAPASNPPRQPPRLAKGALDAPPERPLVGPPANEPGATPSAEEAPPIYRRWWFWAALGAVAVAGGTTAILLARRGNDCPATGGNVCAGW